MGADLAVAYVAIEHDKKPDWEAGKAWIANADVEELAQALDNVALWDEEVETDDDLEVANAVRARVEKVLDAFMHEIENGGRDATTLTIRGLTIYISGGMSWGDAPTDAYDRLSDINWFDGLLEACGFVEDWDELTGLPRPVCNRHGGDWGTDETCKNCTDEAGHPMPIPVEG